METARVDKDQAFRQLYAAYRERIVTYLQRRADPAAIDIEALTADVFETAWKNLDRIPPEPLPWLYVTAANQLSNTRRGAERRRRLLSKLKLAQRPTRPAPRPRGVIERALEALTEPDREILRLVFWDGLKTSEAAIVLGCTPTAASTRLNRAKNRLENAYRAQARAAKD